jgi:hypothetical protein
VAPGPLWHTRFANFAPRLDAAYPLTPKTVVRGGFGLFYDLGYGDVGSAVGDFPYDRQAFFDGPVPFDLTTSPFQPPPFTTTIKGNAFVMYAVDPNLQVPFVMEWNAAVERQIGARQTLTATYVGSDGRRLLREDALYSPSLRGLGVGAGVRVARNGGYSRYNALQVQFQRRTSHGLQALASYTLAKSSDQGSSDTSGSVAATVSDIVLPPLTPSDYDIRHAVSGVVSYEIPAPVWGRVGNAILKGWAVAGLVRVTSPWPINVTIAETSPVIGPYSTQPDVVSGQPFWLPAPDQPGGKVLNPAAFTSPPAGQTGDFPRNGLRGIFSIDQTDVALRRRFNLTERVSLDFRAEYFNVFNHPMFGGPGSGWAPFTNWGFGNAPNPYFGTVSPMLSGGTTNTIVGYGGIVGGQSPLYAVGGPRSAQFTLKLHF